MAERFPGSASDEESFPIPGTPDEPTLEPSEHYLPYAPGGKAPMRADSDIKHDIETALFYKNEVRSFEVQVSVQQGNVTLTGTVSDPTARTVAEDLACRVPGVRQLDNQIQVRQ